MIKQKYMAKPAYYGYFINLYPWKNEFYEVIYHPDSNKIEKIEKLEDEKKLNLYIDYEVESRNKVK